MVDAAVIDEVAARLESDGGPPEVASALVRAAFHGPDAVHAVLAGDPPPETAEATDGGGAAIPGSLYLEKVTVEGFRGVGPEATLALQPGPGLTLVVGRNGSGKSSFAEGAELIITGDSSRWSGKGAKIWRDGWRNVHHGTRRIELSLLAEGHGRPITLTQKWSTDDVDPSDSTAWITQDGHPPRQMPVAEWEKALDAFRPFLSYSELGRMLEEGPSKVYDALASVLGLEVLVDATTVVDDVRKSIEKEVKRVTAEAKRLRFDAEQVEDDRARAILAAIPERGAPDLVAIRAVLEGQAGAVDHSSELSRARELADLSLPDRERFVASAAELRLAAQAVANYVGTDAEAARRTAELLTGALDFHAHVDGDDCPVCGRAEALDDNWRTDTEVEVERLRSSAAAATSARTQLQEAQQHARSLITTPTPLIDGAVDLPVDGSAATAAWRALQEAPAGPTDLADHLERTIDPLLEALVELRDNAAAWVEAKQDLWRPLADELIEWLPDAEASVGLKPHVADLKVAHGWLVDLTAELREARFAPIKDQARSLWEQMRCQSNVSLGELALAGRATRRRLELDVTVDGEAGLGVGVMSQGELNTLALALFLPRAMLGESPFRFVLIDDPVQAMDPARVDGLAQALAQVAESRQVVVFTHDDRLADAARRLELGARIIEVSRRPGSVVEVNETLDPVKRYANEANFLRKANVPDHVRRLLVPSLLRHALEAGAIDALRRRWLKEGRDHQVVEDELDDLETVDLLSLLLLNRRERDKALVYATIDEKLGGDAARLVKACNAGSHEGYGGDLEDLCKRAGMLARRIEETR